MVPAVFSKTKNISLVKVLFFVFFVIFSSLIFITPALASSVTKEFESAALDLQGGGDIEVKCKTLISIAAKIPCQVIPTTGLRCDERDGLMNKARTECNRAAAMYGAKVNVDKLIQNAKLRDKIRETLSFAFKSSLKQFARQVSHDAAVWVASGGRGQKPLFITEGWGTYLKNAADTALGEFIDQIGTSYGVDLCQPDFRVKLMIQTSLNYNRTKQTRCTFTKIMSNWESAISNADFSVEYRNAMRSGENDISFMLEMADQRNSYVADAVNKATKEAETNKLWKDIKNVAGKILTPGTLIANTFRSKTDDAQTTIGLSTFTNTAADMVEEFGNTLVSQLLTNLQSGLFASGNSGGSTGKSTSNNLLPDPDTLANLFNFNSSPVIGGTAGAQEKFMNLVTSREKVGNRYDVLIKLANCPESAKLNPDVSDCVIDTSLSEKIKQKVYVKDLPDAIKNRAFAPSINQTNSLENEIPYRSVLVLRKYRIVPVGWEIAANKIRNSDKYPIKDENGNTITKRWTLSEMMDCYYGTSTTCVTADFKGLVDPNWLLKVYEAYCRREGYGAHNSSGLNNQEGDISRDNYCADEQQCLFDDSKGNCKSYGYCSEERNLWELGNSCEPIYNTCQTYGGRSGSSNSLLKNSLDFSNCSSLNVGCRSLTGNFNSASAVWNGEFFDSNNNLLIYKKAFDLDTLVVGNDSGWLVPEYHNVSNNYRLKTSKACSAQLCSGAEAKCEYTSSTRTCSFRQSSFPNNQCQVLPQGISCMIEACYDQTNVIQSMNVGFESNESTNQGDSTLWTDELSYFDLNNRHYRSTDQKHSGSAALRLFSSNNQVALVTRLKDIPLEKDSVNYVMKFWAKGFINSGNLRVGIGYEDGSSVDFRTTILVSQNSWKEYSVSFNSNGHSTGTIKIISDVGTVADVYLDDFSIKKMTTSCGESGSIQLFTEPDIVASNKNQTSIYLDRDAAACSSQDDGCSLFLRNKANVGGNLIYNGGFEHGLDGWTQFFGAASSWTSNGMGGVMMSGYDTATYNSYRPAIIDGGDYYSIAFDVAKTSTSSPDYKATLEMIFVTNLTDAGVVSSHLTVPALDTNCVIGGDRTVNLNITPNGTNYERGSCWFRVPVGAKYIMFKPFVNYSAGGGQLFIDNIKLEKVSLNSLGATTYTSYDAIDRPSNQVSYLKKAPDYFGCYRTPAGNWPEREFELVQVLQQRHEMCSNYSGVCTKKEVGCESYTPTNGDPEIPGIVDNLDLCPSECSGYQVYKQEKTFFATSTFKQFIADKKAKYCSASYAGCDEFTNLDEINQGAENKEYYVQFRVCQKPSVDDRAYYTWEGSDTTGYQLKSFNFKKSDENSAPCTNLYYYGSSTPQAGQNYCNDPINNGVSLSAEEKLSFGICVQTDMISNPDCREFYDVDGNVYYRLLSRTVTVSDNCHPYRRTPTQSNIGQIQSDCSASHGYFNANNECIYMAVPKEGRTCPAVAKGCRSYTGNQGNNIRKIVGAVGFDQDITQIDWVDQAGNKDGLQISSESTYPGGNSLSNKAGNSIIKRRVSLTQNKTYILSFWAKGDSTFYLDNVKFNSAGANTDNYFTYSRVAGDNLLMDRVLVNNDWHYYELGPVFVSWDPGLEDYLVFELASGQKIYLDNIILKEINNNVYAIENSWYTPISCDNRMDDPDGKRAIAANNCQDQSTGRCSIGEMVGCQSYKDRFNNIWHLRSFSSLCRKDAVGCEALIDTHNSNSPLEQTFNLGNDVGVYDADVVKVPADEIVYMVNDSKYSCQSAAKGCQALGLPLIDRWDEVYGYATVFIKNDPDSYDTSMCKHSELWCEQYATNDSTAYFKDPHGKVCQYGKPSVTASADWYISGTNIPCNSTLNQTIGTGYEPSYKKKQPIGPVDNVTMSINSNYTGWVGTCPTDKSGCSEYIDPLPFIYTNKVLQTSCSGSTCNNVRFKTNTLYSFSLQNNSSLNFTLTPSSQVDCPSTPTINTIIDGKTFSIFGGNYFYIPVDINGPTDCVYSISTSDGHTFNFNEDIRLHKDPSNNYIAGDKITIAGVYYATKNSVNKSECSGAVDFNNGCVLFNDRDGVNYSIVPNSSSTADKRFFSYLTYKTWDTFMANIPLIGNQKPASPVVKTATDVGGNSNLILKVKPNRTCSNWLMCTTYEKGSEKDPSLFFSINDRCLQFKACDYLDENGQCENFVDHSTSTIVNQANISYFAGASGYAGADLKYYDVMQQNGGSSVVANGNFENGFNDTTEPIGWRKAYYRCPTANSCSNGDPKEDPGYWLSSFFSISNEGGIAYEGSKYLKLNTGNGVISEIIELDKKGDYIVSFWVNTMNLNGPGYNNDPVRAEAQLRFLNATNNQPLNASSIKILSINGGVSNPSFSSGGWLYSNDLRVKRGDNWTQRKVRLRIDAPAPVNMEMVLLNMNPDAPPKTYDNNKIGGYSAWDDIEVKPMLQTSDDYEINRSCRVFPTADAKACNYEEDAKSYYGQYGYCLLKDPNNSQQCLQWWPVDTIKGEILSDFSGYYKERYPLYYCLEKKIVDVDFGSLMGSIGVFGRGADKSGLGNWKFDRNGSEVSLTPFNIPSIWSPLFRYPFVYRINYSGLVVVIGSTASHSIGVTALSASMWPNMVCAGAAVDLANRLINDVFGAGARIGCWARNVPIDNPNYTVSSETTQRNVACVDGPNKNDACTQNLDCGGWKADVGVCGNGVSNLDPNDSCKYTDGSSSRGSLECKDRGSILDGLRDFFASLFNGIVSLLDGLISLLTGTSLGDFGFNEGDSWGGWGALTLPVSIPLFGGIEYILYITMPYHVAANLDKGVLLQIANALEELIKLGTFGMKIITDEDVDFSGSLNDPDPSNKGNILGYGFFIKSPGLGSAGDKTGAVTTIGTLKIKSKVQYCSKIVRVVSSGGQNKSWAARLSLGSGYTTRDNDCIIDSENSGLRQGDDGKQSDLNGKDCFYASMYCINNDLLGDKENLCGNYLKDDPSGIVSDPSDNTRRLVCDSSVSDGIKKVKSIGSSGDEKILHDYFCPEGTNRVYQKIYSNNYYNYNTDYKPYGSLVAPTNGQYPNAWDTRPDSNGNQPIFYELPMGQSLPAQSRMGQVHTVSNLRALFAKTYGYWEWSNDMQEWKSSGSYINKTDQSGDPQTYQWTLPYNDNGDPNVWPDGYCNFTNRSEATENTWCKIKPVFTTNPSITPEFINNIGSVRFVFTVEVDANQLPLKSFTVEWGDGEKTAYSGVSLLNRPNQDNPLTLYHSYGYYDLFRNSSVSKYPLCSTTTANVLASKKSCCDSSVCVMLPSVSVIDNWNAEATTTSINTVTVKNPNQ